MLLDTDPLRSPLRRMRSNELANRSENQNKTADSDLLDFLNPSSGAVEDSPPRSRHNTKRAGDDVLDTRAKKKGKKSKVSS